MEENNFISILVQNFLTLEDGKIKIVLKFIFAFQEVRLLPWKNVIDNIFGIKSKKYKKINANNLAKKYSFKIWFRKDDLRNFKRFKWRMKQRVSFVRALVLNPSLLFLDEPFQLLILD